MINRKFLSKIVEVYKSYLGDNLISIILFGSRARGESDKGSDYDLFIIARNLPESPLKRMIFIRSPIVAQFKERISIIAKTIEEVENSFPPLFLDLGIDGIILYDDDFFSQKQKRIKEIIKSAGLKRVKVGDEFSWEWDRKLKGGWEIDWRGFRELSERR